MARRTVALARGDLERVLQTRDLAGLAHKPHMGVVVRDNGDGARMPDLVERVLRAVGIAVGLTPGL